MQKIVKTPEEVPQLSPVVTLHAVCLIFIQNVLSSVYSQRENQINYKTGHQISPNLTVPSFKSCKERLQMWQAQSQIEMKT